MFKSLVLDSNILVYAHNKQSPFHQAAKDLVEGVLTGSIEGYLTQQNLLEFYSVITDKRRIEKPLTCKEAFSIISDYLSSPFIIVGPVDKTMEILKELCQKLSLKDGAIFDAYLVATMISHDLNTIITLNTADFIDFPQIEAVALENP